MRGHGEYSVNEYTRRTEMPCGHSPLHEADGCVLVGKSDTTSFPEEVSIVGEIQR